MRIKPPSPRPTGKLLGAMLPLILVLGAGGAGFYWWQSPARKIQGDWDIPSGGIVAVNSTITFKGGIFQKSGTFTMIASLGGGGLSLSSGESGSYTIDTSTDPATLTMTPQTDDRKPAISGSSKGHVANIRFVDNDTLQVEDKGALAIKMEFHRKKK